MFLYVRRSQLFSRTHIVLSLRRSLEANVEDEVDPAAAARPAAGLLEPLVGGGASRALPLRGVAEDFFSRRVPFQDTQDVRGIDNYRTKKAHRASANINLNFFPFFQTHIFEGSCCRYSNLHFQCFIFSLTFTK